MRFLSSTISTVIPTCIIGPLKIVYVGNVEQVSVPMATFESPLWYSTKRGAMVSQKTSGISTAVLEDIMTRSIILEANDVNAAILCKKWIENNQKAIGDVVRNGSRFAQLKAIHLEVVGPMIYARFAVETGNASGHNMVTIAADAVAKFIVAQTNVRYASISSNCCCDKKVSAINGILGRGKRTVAEIVVPKSVCAALLKASPEEIVKLNVKKNLLGSILAGGVRSANAHFANAVLAIYLATGQDAANLVEASQGITYADVKNNGELYFSVTLPNIIVGVVGNGKHLDFAKKNMESMGCFHSDPHSSQRLAAVMAAAVLCSELSLLAAQTNGGELLKMHLKLERNIIL
jgi:hydroxymethylglutaryl-CoA reductase (NADPH)